MLVLSIAVALSATTAAQTPNVKWSHDTTNLELRFGSVQRIGDVDGDDVADFGIACRDRAIAISGSTGSTLHEFLSVGTANLDYLLPIADAGDLDHDEFDDIAVGMIYDATAPQSETEPRVGSIRLFSGKDGSLLRTIYGSSHAWIGTKIATLGDVDGDGATELAIASLPYPLGSDFRVDVISCTDGATRFSLAPPSGLAFPQTSMTLRSVGDSSGDGVTDFVVSYFQPPVLGNGSSIVKLISGKDGSLVREIAEPEICVLGSQLGEVGDIDGDGLADVLLGSTFGADESGSDAVGIARAYSGANGKVLWTREGADPYGEFGLDVVGVGDVDLDGAIDVAAPEPFRTRGARPEVGMVHLFSHGSGHPLSCGLESNVPFEHFGISVTPGADIDLDGAPNLAIATRGSSSIHSRVELRSLSESAPQQDRFVLGSRLRGELGDGDSKDDAEFECLSGTSIRLEYQRKAGDLRVRIAIARVGHAEALAWTPKASDESTKKTFTIDQDGRYELRIDRIGGTSGDYSLKTSIAKKPKNTPFGFNKTVEGLGSSEAPQVRFRAVAGTMLFGSVEGITGLPTQPQIEMLSPNGVAFDLSTALELSDPNETELAQIELPSTGTFELRTVAPGGESTKAKFVIDIPRVSGHERIEID